MTARVLVVDDLLPNVKLLEARLTAEYFDVLTASNGPDAISICDQGLCDIVLTDVMMPGMDGFEVTRRIKANPSTAHIPVVMVTALDQPSDRVKGLEAGADDFLTKPVNEIALIARVRSLVRLKAVTDELRSRALTSRDAGMGDPLVQAVADTGVNGRILLVDDRPGSADRLIATLSQHHMVTLEPNAQQALFAAAADAPDLVVVSLDLADYDGLRLCSQLRSVEATRHLGILALAEAEDTSRILRGLDLGVNDYLVRPIDRNELLARVRTQVRRKRYADRLRDTVHATIELAIVDALTGLHNRRYLDSHFGALVEESLNRGRPLSVLVLDVDKFKSVNDTYGHDAGDDVLREFAQRVRKSLRAPDLVARFGGEELVVVMPDTSLETARLAAERIRARVGADPFAIHKGSQFIPVTVSIGVAATERVDDTPDTLLKRADQALYRAKETGRNRVIVSPRAA
ncbi:PleD family two-component system response regulator [Alsobacter metallidurans]|uniref:diguanylate cyclase n=1 Tax=Alsobacter metallidurans TaxID=340221 RepID=A0A917I8Q4_9HYPH|nr:PleD family two-component system response regulator [Alsobacter metallidurans]GGH24954.1 PleD family two-component system response regulator [Alsobacter metallidurans]